jgi:hypothetical protein
MIGLALGLTTKVCQVETTTPAAPNFAQWDETLDKACYRCVEMDVKVFLLF